MSARSRRLLLVPMLILQALAGVEISDHEGRVIQVQILAIEDSRIEIRMKNGQPIWLERSRLSDASNAMITSRIQEQANAYQSLNEAFGIPLFADSNLWDDETKAAAKRLGWPRESKTANQSSYRLYPEKDERILGARPYSAVIYGSEDRTESFSIVFANKGDIRFSDPPTSEQIRNLERAIENDLETLRKVLTRELGQPERQQFGAGRGMKQLIERWDWQGHAFILAAQDGEYVNLRIITTVMADNKGRTEKLSDAALRKLTLENIKKLPNGDVLIDNIPMVDQGPKGYCVPATFERYLRFLKIPADMYLLAMAGQTGIGGGTSISEIVEAIKGKAASQNRSMKKITGEIDMRTVRKYIDRGLPLIWAMFSSREYNSFVNARTKDRSKTSHWDQWATRTKKEVSDIELRKDMMSAHACMIIGYNKATGEIAVSDSWGPSYAIRWLPAEQAEQVSQGYLYLIEY